MRELAEFCCQNPDCPDAGLRGKGNLRWHGWSSKKSGIRGLFCRTCRKYFSERKGTALEHSRLPKDKAVSLIEHLREDCGVRSTARLLRISSNTVIRYARLAGDHAARTHDELVEFSPSDEGSATR